MIDHLFPFYERELRYLNQLTQEFAQRHPNAAKRLELEATGSSDPYVQRLLETFALLAGRTKAKLEDEFPEVTDALLQVLYPHFLAPIPSMAMVQFQADPSRVQVATGHTIPRGATLEAATAPAACKFRTAYPVTLWPMRVSAARFFAPPFPPGLQPPAGAGAAIGLTLECVGGELTFAQLRLDRLRLHLAGDPQNIADLYEMIFNHAIQVAFLPDRATGGRGAVALPPEVALCPVGFERDEGLLPYPDQARLGYRLLTEFFTFPAKFQFVDLAGWTAPALKAALPRFKQRCDVLIFCKKTHRDLEQRVNSDTFRLGCTPVVNLFERDAEPIRVHPKQPEYRIVADRTTPQAVEVYAAARVSSTEGTTNRTTAYLPFFGLNHSRPLDGAEIYWHTTRHRSLALGDSGTEVFLGLVDRDFVSSWPTDEMLQVRVMCTNRDLPSAISSASQPIEWVLEQPAPISGVQCLRLPTPPLRPAPRGGKAWELISHLCVNPLSLEAGPAGLAAFRDLLRLYDFSDPAAGQKHLKDEAMQIVDGVLSVRYRRVLGRVPSDPQRGLCRGLEVTMELDPDHFPRRGAYLFAAVIERFLSLYATTSSFTELNATTPRGPFKKWPARTGAIPLM